MAAYNEESLDIVKNLNSNVETGLTEDKIELLIEEYGLNELHKKQSIPAWQQFLNQFNDPIVFLLLIATVISLIVWLVEGAIGFPFDVAVIVLILLINAIIGFFQEKKAETSLEQLKSLSSTHNRVLRNGIVSEIESKFIVPGDIVFLNEGDIVPADSRIIECFNFKTLEANLTGEAEAIVKSPDILEGDVVLADRLNMVYSSTTVVTGTAKVVAIDTAMSTEVGKIASLLDETKKEKTPLEIKMTDLSKKLGVGICVICVIVILAIFLTQPINSFEAVIQTVLLGVSLAVSAVPEGMVAVLSVVLSIGVAKMATKNAIVRKLSSVETLGSCNVICSDKTGTLTKNKMSVERILNIQGDDATDELVKELLIHGSLANNTNYNSETNSLLGDPTETSIVQKAIDQELYHDITHKYSRQFEIPFSSERKIMSTIDLELESNELFVSAKGAPEILVEHCTKYFDGQKIVELTNVEKNWLDNTIFELSKNAYRTLGVAYKILGTGTGTGTGTETGTKTGTGTNETNETTGPEHNEEQLESDLIYIGTIGIIDPPRPEAAKAIELAKQGGVRTIMITGDHPLTASKIASELGMDATTALSSKQLSNLTDEQFVEAVQKVNVYARVTPEDKMRIVQVLQSLGNVVAMTGDGVNDAPAIKQSNIGLAMGITGTEVTKETADMVLADDNFATIVSAIKQGRVILNNIIKFLRFLLTTNSGEVFTIFLGVVFAHAFGLLAVGDTLIVTPIVTVQILWINLLTDSFPALAMGVDNLKVNVMKEKPRDSKLPIINSGMWFDIILFGFIMGVMSLVAIDLCLPGGFFSGDINTTVSGGSDLIYNITGAQTTAFTGLVLAQLMYAFASRSDSISLFKNFFSNKALILAVGAGVILQILVIYVPFLNHAFSTVPLNLTQWLICLCFPLVILGISEFKKYLVRHFR
jgi:magnesium-transporting ATPase (P-type)